MRFSKKKKISAVCWYKKSIIQAKGNFNKKHFYTDFTLSSNTVQYNIHIYEKLPRYIKTI